MNFFQELVSKSFYVSRSKSRGNSKEKQIDSSSNDKKTLLAKEKTQPTQNKYKQFPNIYENVGKFPAYLGEGFFLDKGYMKNFPGKNNSSFIQNKPETTKKTNNINDSIDNTHYYHKKNDSKTNFPIKSNESIDKTQLIMRKNSKKIEDDIKNSSLNNINRFGTKNSIENIKDNNQQERSLNMSKENIIVPHKDSRDFQNNFVQKKNSFDKTTPNNLKKETSDYNKSDSQINPENRIKEEKPLNERITSLSNKPEEIAVNKDQNQVKTPEKGRSNSFFSKPNLEEGAVKISPKDDPPLNYENLEENFDEKKSSEKIEKKEDLVKTNTLNEIYGNKPVIISETFVVNYQENEYEDEFENFTERNNQPNNDEKKDLSQNKFDDSKNQRLDTEKSSQDISKENLFSNNIIKEEESTNNHIEMKKHKKKGKKSKKHQNHEVEADNNNNKSSQKIESNKKQINQPNLEKNSYIPKEINSLSSPVDSPKKILYEYNVDFMESPKEKSSSKFPNPNAKVKELSPIRLQGKSSALEPLASIKSSLVKSPQIGSSNSLLDHNISGKIRDSSSPSKLFGKTAIDPMFAKSLSDSPNKLNKLEPLKESGSKKQGKLMPIKGSSFERPLTQEGNQRKKGGLEESPPKIQTYEVEKFCSLNIPIKKAVKKVNILCVI